MIRNKLFEKKINYAEEAEAPMILGTKILKKLKKDWGEDSDIYYEIEDILIDLGSDSPRRLAMALKRVLTNYDMWESPYKGYVNKIEKWTKPTGKVNESREEEIRKNRFDGLVEKIEYYSNIYKEKGALSVKQLEDLLSVKNNIIVYGKYGVWWASFAEEILEEHGVKDEYDIEELYKDLYYDRENGFIYESFSNKDEEIISKLEEICEDLDSAKLKLFFNSSDANAIEKRFAHKIKKSPVKSVYRRGLKAEMDDLVRPKKKQYRNYVATFYTPNSGYGNRYACVLSELEFTGYGVSSSIVCELSFEEFYDLLKYFKFEGGEYVRDDYKSLLESNNPLSKPLFRKPTHFVKTYKDEVFDILDDLINKGDIGYEDLEDIYNSGNVTDEVVEYIASETNYGHSEGTKRYILNIIGEYYENAYREHLRDINEDMNDNTQTKNNSNSRSKNTRQSAKNRPSANYTKDIEKNKQQRTKESKKSSNRGKAAIAGAVAGATYLGKKYIVDPISKSLGDD